MNKLAGATGVSVAEILETQEPADNAPMSEAVHARLEPREQMVLEFLHKGCHLILFIYLLVFYNLTVISRQSGW